MPLISSNRDAAIFDSTPIENRFLMEYLPSAPENCLRVYLALRMLMLHPELGDSLSEMAAMLHMDDTAIEGALSYWEHEGVIQRTSDREASYIMLPFRENESYSDPNERHFYEMRDFNGSLQQLFDISKGPDYILTPKLYALTDDWHHIFRIPQEGILMLLREELRGNSKRPNTVITRLNKKIGAWAQEGKALQTMEDIERLIASGSYSASIASRILKQLSIHRQPSVDEVKLANKWVNEWELTEAQLIEACAETTKSRNPSMAYLDSILSSRRSGSDVVFRTTQEILSELGIMDAKPTPDQQKRVAELLEAGFERETLTLAAVQCARSNRRRFEDFDWMADQWQKNNLFKKSDAEAFVEEGRRNVEETRRILQLAGSDKRPGKSDIDAYLNLRNNYDPALLAYAAECAKGMQLPFHYMQKVLAEWGNISVEEARARHETHVREKTGQSPAPANPALHYAQRDVSDADYEHLFMDLNTIDNEESKK